MIRGDRPARDAEEVEVTREMALRGAALLAAWVDDELEEGMSLETLATRMFVAMSEEARKCQAAGM